MAKRPRKKKTDSPVSARESWSSFDSILGLTLLLAVMLVYQPVWHAGYIWDDDLILTANPVIIGPFGLKEIWTTHEADICPLTLTTFWVENALWGVNPLPYHLVNVFLHGACAVLLWWVLRNLNIPGAWLGAALWAVHPVEIESVAWITEMKNTQSCLFYLLAILFFVKYLRTGSTHSGKSGVGWNYSLTLIFAALAMASKSSTVVLPLVLCLCAWWIEGRWQWRILARIAPLFLMSIAACALSIWTQGFALAISVDPQWTRTWPQRLTGAGDAVWFYLGKLIWPHPLMTVYPRWQIDASQPLSYLPLLAVIVVLVILWLKRESWGRPYFFAWSYFLVALLPALGLIDNSIFRYSLVFDHLQYLADIGPLALAGAGLARLANFTLPGRMRLQSILCAGPVLLLGILSWQRTWVYESQETLWTDALAKNPACWAGYVNLGVALKHKGLVDEAITQYEKALELNPNDAEAHNSLGNALLQKGRVDEAMVQLQAALKINPTLAEAHNNLGNALLQKGHVDEAMSEYQQALDINPSLAETHNNLGNAFLQKGRVDDAQAQYLVALAMNPNSPEFHNNLGITYAQKGRVNEAISQYQESLRLKPGFSDAQKNLAAILATENAPRTR